MAPIDPENHLSGPYVIVRNIMLTAAIPKAAEGVEGKSFQDDSLRTPSSIYGTNSMD